MIKVTVRERVFTEAGGFKEIEKVREHAKGNFANVHNGVLTIYSNLTDSEKAHIDESKKYVIAGYEPSTWLSWEKA